MQQKTFVLKKKDIQKNWHLIDAEKVVLGRLAVKIANLLRGKGKVGFSPNADCGDRIVVVNAEKVFLTGKKVEDKLYHYHTGYPGGLKTRTMRQRLEGHRPEEVLRRAVKLMMPKGPLRETQLKNLYIYNGVEHAHAAQNPTTLDMSNIRRK